MSIYRLCTVSGLVLVLSSMAYSLLSGKRPMNFLRLLRNKSSLSSKVGGLKKFESEKTLLPVSLSEELIGKAIQLVSDAFPYEGTYSWTRALGLPGNLSAFLTSESSKYITDKPGSIGMTDTTGALQGVLLLEDLVLPPALSSPPVTETNNNDQPDKDAKVTTREVEEASDNDAYAPLYALLDGCNEIFRTGLRARTGSADTSVRGEYCYVAWVAVRADCQSRGVAGTLLRHSNELLARQGYRLAVAYCSSPRSTRAFQRAGYEVWGHITYADFQFGNQRPFQSLPDEVSVLVRTF